MIERLLLVMMLTALAVGRRVLQAESRLFALLAAPSLQPLLAWIGRLKAYRVYIKARRDCPAYADFLKKQNAPEIHRSADLPRLPETTKENFIKKYTIEERCFGGKIPRHGVVIDESSGSSGMPNSWVRGPAERASVKSMMQISYSLMFRDADFFILNCFALGPWATGMNVSMSLVDVAIMKSIGPEKVKLENALRQFGPKYRYLLAGYPPFMKNFVDTVALDLSHYELHLILGGEGMSEGLRNYFGRVFKSVFSSYGASDLEINIGAETDFTVAVRKKCWKNPALSKALFGREDPPMIFQFNPLDYLIEQNQDGELVFTITRITNVAPKIRYNLHDRGGVYTHRDLLTKLQQHGVARSEFPAKVQAFPVLYLYGRNDLTVPFYGAKIFTSDIDNIIHQDPALAQQLNSFQLRCDEDEKHDRRLHLSLERSERCRDTLDEAALHTVFYEGLMRVNQDFREITKMITPEHVRVTVHAYGTAPFADRDIRVKCKYISA